MLKLRAFISISTSVICVVLLSFSGLVSAGTISKVRSIEGISEYALDNGLQLLLFPDQSKDTITVNVTYHVGSKHENYGETGMAHLLEHLLFKGSKSFPNITEDLSTLGAETNGSTWYERTNYFETFKASEKNLKWVLAMEADRMVNSFVAQKDLDSEMTVVRNEFERGENSPTRILLQRIYANAFDWHNYGKTTMGSRADIENVKIENLQAFYRKYYQPDNTTLILAGKFDPKVALDLVAKSFGKIKKPKRQLPDFYTLDPAQDGERSLVLRRVGGEQVVAAAYHIPAGSHKDFAAIEVLSTILGDSPSGRLHKQLIEKNLATSTWAWPNQQKDPGLLYFNATTNLKTNIEKTQSALLKTIENLKKTPITSKEVERAKRKLLKQINLSFNNSQELSINLSEWIGIGDWRMMFIHRDRLEQVSLNDVQAVANQYLIPSNRTLGKFIPTDRPQRAHVPAAPNLDTLLANYKGRKPISQGEIFDTSLENISTRLIKSQNAGLNIAAVPIKTRGNSVYVSLRMGIGNINSLEGKSELAAFTASMLLRGIKRLSREELQDEFDILKTEGGFSGKGQAVVGQFETTRENLPKLLDLIHEILTTPTFPEKEFALLKSQKLSRKSVELTDPQALGFNAIVHALSGYPKGHLFYQPTIEEKAAKIQSIELADVKTFYRDHYGGDDLQIGLAGDFNFDNIQKRLNEKFAYWQNKVKYDRALEGYQDISRDEKIILTPDKKNTVFIAARNIDLAHRDKDAAAMYIATRIIGGGFLNSRLAYRLRQKDGLSYTAKAVLQLGKNEHSGKWIAYAISAPENTEKVHRAFIEEMERAIAKGFTQKELDDAIKGFIDAAKVRRGDNSALSTLVRDFMFEGYTFDEEIRLHERIQKLTLDDVNRATKALLDPRKMTIIKAGDFE